MSDNFIHLYQQYTAPQASPGIFHVSCALWCMASAVGRGAWFGVEDRRWGLFPNLFITLVAPQGMCYKSTAIRVATEILDLANIGTKLPESTGSKQAIFFSLRRSQVPWNAEHISQIVKGAAGYLAADELGSFLGTGQKVDRDLMLWLGSWFDCPLSWTYATVGRMEDSEGNLKAPPMLFEPCINAIFGTTPKYLQDTLPEGCTEEGFGSRNLWIYRRFSDRKLGQFSLDWPLKDVLVKQLQHIHKAVGGSWQFNEEAKEAHGRWYSSWHQEMKLASAYDPIAGFRARKDPYIKKLSLLHAIANPSQRATRIIPVESLAWADQFLSAVQDGVGEIFQAQGQDRISKFANRIISAMRDKPHYFITRRELTDICGISNDTYKAIQMLAERGWVQGTRQFDGTREVRGYVLTEEALA